MCLSLPAVSESAVELLQTHGTETALLPSKLECRLLFLCLLCLMCLQLDTCAWCICATCITSVRHL